MGLSSDSRDDIVAEIKERADIVQIIGEHVTLKRSGVRYLGICPFHHEKTPSFSVHGGQQFYHCFGCKESGDVFSFMMKYHNLDFPGALKALAQRYQIALPERKKSPRQLELEKKREQMFMVNEQVTEIYHHSLKDPKRGERARHYLSKRGIGEPLQERYRLGYAPAVETVGWNFLGSQLTTKDRLVAVELGLLAEKQQGGTYDRFRERIIFPISDSRGRIAGFGGRVLGEGNPKYLNSPESLIYNKSNLLFGFYEQRDAIRSKRQALLVEGNFDLLVLVNHGIEQVVAPLGTALTREQVRKLKPLADEIVLLFDGDEAGLKAVERSVGIFLAEQVSGRVAVLPPEHDPDTYLRQNGLESLSELIESADSLPEFVVDRLIARHGLTLDGKARIIKELNPLMTLAQTGLQRSMWASHFGSILGVEPEEIVKGQGSPAPLNEHIRSGSVSLPEQKRAAPLSGPLKPIVAFMILHPEYLGDLAQYGLEEQLSGTIGEVIFLQLRLLQDQKQGTIHPEDLLTGLPEGEERSLVASVLTNAPQREQVGEEQGQPEEELGDILKWLEQARLKKESDNLITEINKAQKNSDIGRISELLQKKMNIDALLKNRS